MATVAVRLPPSNEASSGSVSVAAGSRIVSTRLDGSTLSSTDSRCVTASSRVIVGASLLPVMAMVTVALETAPSLSAMV